jgi:hypothetical protein
VREQSDEISNSHAFWASTRDTLFSENGEGFCEFVDDANGERFGEREKVGAMDERSWAKRAGVPRDMGETVFDCEGMIQQTLRKGLPRLADDSTRAKQPPVRPPRR